MGEMTVGLSDVEMAAMLAAINATPDPIAVLQAAGLQPEVITAGLCPPLDDEGIPMPLPDGALALLADDNAWRGPVNPAPNLPVDDTCHKCGQPLEGRWGWFGEHPGACPYVAPKAALPVPVVTPGDADGDTPSPTLADLRPALIDFENNRPRSLQTDLGPSQIAVACDRRLAYSLAGRGENQDGRVKWAAMQGTATHAMLAEVMAQANTALGRERWLIEEKVWPDDRTYGHCDAFDTDTATVIDWKLVGITRLKGYKAKGPGPQYIGQAQLYGLGWQRAGRDVRWVRIVFLARTNEFDDSHEWTARYDPAYAQMILDRRDRVAASLRIADALPQTWENVDWAGIGETPNDDCVWCPYFRRGGAADHTGCPGDVAAQARKLTKATAGIIPPCP